MNEFKAYTRYQAFSDELETALILKFYDGRRFYYTLNQIEYDLYKVDAVKPLIDPDQKLFISNSQVLQSIMDTAWENGMRPTGFTDVKNETAAIRYHLEDMRKLIFERALTIKQLP